MWPGTQRVRLRPNSSYQTSVWPPNFTSQHHSGRAISHGIAVAQPLVGLLDLPAVDDLLLEDAELVADAVAQRRHFERGQRIDEAGREAAEAAVAQARLVFVG